MELESFYLALPIFLCINYFLRHFLNIKIILETYYLGKPKNLTECYGEWAVVTGCTDGIGKSYAYELAKRGLNIVLISRGNEKLGQVSREIESTWGVKTKVIVADFSLGNEEYGKIFCELENVDVGILVNNVGTADGLPNLFEDMTQKQVWNLMTINVCAAVAMAHYILPKLKSKKRGIIINIGSFSSFSPTPRATLYGASKAFIENFSTALICECKGSGVEVQTVLPGFVDTKIIESNARKMPSIFFPTPERYVKSAVRTIGKVAHTSGYLPHDIQRLFLLEIPMRWRTWFGNYFFEVNKRY